MGREKKLLQAITAAIALAGCLASPGVAQDRREKSAVMRDQVLSGSHGRSEVKNLLQTTVETHDPRRHEMRMALLLRKNEVLPVLTDRLKTAPDQEKYDLLMLIHGQLRWREFQPVVLKLLRDKTLSEHVRGRAATASALYQQTEAVPDIRDLLKSAKEDQVRQWAATALATLGDKDSLPEIEIMLRDTSPFVRVTAAMALGMLGSDAGLEQALALSYEDFFGLRCRAAEALSHIATSPAMTRLREMETEDTSSTVRSESAEYLGQVELRALDKDAALDRLKEMLNPENPNPPRWAFVYLAEHFGPEAAPFLRQLAESPGPLRHAASVAVLQVESGMSMAPHIRSKAR